MPVGAINKTEILPVDINLSNISENSHGVWGGYSFEARSGGKEANVKNIIESIVAWRKGLGQKLSDSDCLGLCPPPS